MKKKILLIICAFVCLCVSGQAHRTRSISPEIYSLQVNLNGNWSLNPILTQNSTGDYVHISFDRISDYSSNRLRYRVLHCDAFWNVSEGISEIDYLNGFNDSPINDYAYSVNTTVEYTHFNLDIPNRDVNVNISGNYVVEVYEEGIPEKVLLTACFSVMYPLVTIGAEVSSNTDIDTNKSHQQLSFTIHNQGLNIRDVASELKVFAFQNKRLDSERKLLKPSYVYPNKLVFDHNRDLIFEAGNEYRRFETSSYRYNGMNVKHVEYKRPDYIMHIVPDKIRAERSYSYDQDQNGRYIIRSNESELSETEADYFVTNFTLEMSSPSAKDIYINGEFTNNTFSDKYRMKYDQEGKAYHLSLVLKQGLYNYMYLMRNDKYFTTSTVEGNYHEAENEYSVLVYYRPSGQRYDGLIGTLNIQSRIK